MPLLLRDNRYYSSTLARFTTPDPYGPSAHLGNPQSWNRYSYVGNDPINFNDPLGLCPPGMVEADSPQDIDLILRTARSYLGQSIPHDGSGHYTTVAGTLTAIDCSQLVMQALAGIPWSDPFRPAAIANLFVGNMGTRFSRDSAFRVGDIITFSEPRHTVIATGVDAEGNVTSFIGSQTTRGVQEVTNAQENPYWGPRLRSATTAAYKPCVPDNRHTSAQRPPDGPDLIVGGPASGVPWWMSAMYTFEGWLRSISIGVATSTIVYPGGAVTSSISYLYLVGK